MRRKIFIIFILAGFLISQNPYCFNALAEDQTAIAVLDIKEMDVQDVLKLISQKSGWNIIAGQNVRGRVTVYLRDIGAMEALKIICESYDWAYVRDGEIVKVMTRGDFRQRYGHDFGEKVETRVKQILFARAEDVMPVIQQMKSSSGKIIADKKSNSLILIDTPKKLADMEVVIAKMDVPIETEIFDLSYARAEDISKKIEDVLTPGVGVMRYDERSNKIVVSDTALKIREISRILEAFDERNQEVFIDAKILQIALSDEHKMGVDWEAIVADYHTLDFKSNFDVLSTSDKRGMLSIGTLANDEYEALIEALDTIGKTNILSSPRITTLNNREARILVGSSEPYVTTTTTTPSSGPVTTAESVNFIEVGVKLYVTPQIHNDGFITMKIKPEISSVVDNVTTSNNNTIPVVETSEAETSVMVKNGVTIVIGGLIKEENIQTIKRVPLLGSIPLIGLAFKNTSDKTARTEIVILLQPRIVTGDVMADKEHLKF